MGYLPNGAAGDRYEAAYCDHCAHQNHEGEGCAVWLAHMLHNYDECNKKDSILHILIPRNGIENEQCKMFVKKKG